jgi:hypothetical protein
MQMRFEVRSRSLLWGLGFFCESQVCLGTTLVRQVDEYIEILQQLTLRPYSIDHVFFFSNEKLMSIIF